MGCGGSKPDDAPAVETKPEPATKPAETKPEPAAEEAKAEDGPLSQGEIENRIKGMDKPETFELGISGFILRYGVLSQRGYYPEDLFKQNQDRYLISPNVAGEKSSILLGVFDGHGQDGHECADFVRKQCIPTLTKMMKKPEYQYNFTKAYIATWVTIDAEMHEHDDFNDFQSGSTSICAVFRGKEMYVSNIGDSRAIIGERNGKRILAQPLSIDQTPYRADERERVKACGATIMTQAMMLGDEDYTPGWDDKIGAEDLDGSGEPPRIYDSRKNQWGETEYLDRPGTAFTRSIGDSSASHLGVSAEAELLHKQITEKDQMIALASDGVWEFLTNQSVCDTIMHFDDPIEACRQVISQAYGLWLQFEVRTDDITLIVAFIDMVGDNGKAPRPPNEDEIAMYADRKTMAGDGGSGGLSAGGGGFKPVRRGLSAEKKKELGVSAMDEDDDTQDQGEWKMEVIKKTKSEIERIKAALKGNFLFAHLPAPQAKQIYDVMKKRMVTEGECVIKQGDPGEHFFILDDGEFRVTILKDGKQIEILRYKPNPAGANPCFGELALMYSKPRAASVTAMTDGALWEIDRRSFREILKKSSTKNLMRTLRSVQILKSLSVAQMQRLSEILSEVTMKPGEFILKQGEEGDSFYIISEGTAIVTKTDPTCGEQGRVVAELGPGQYFGERALLKEEARAANVIAAGDSSIKCLAVSKDAFEEVLGPLESIMNEEANWRYKMAFAKQLKKNAVGLCNAQAEDFDIEGVVADKLPVRYMLAVHNTKAGKNRPEGKIKYTLKVRSKKQIVEYNMQARLRAEMKLATNLIGNNSLVPMPLTTMEDDSYIYSVFDARLSCLLADYIETKQATGGLPEAEVKFFAACLTHALDVLHNEIPVMGGVIYRNLDVNSITLDQRGWPQLTDMRYACQAEPPPRDYCGQSHYLSPEQVQGQGHGLASDFWALGVAMYEMVSTGNPWLTGNAIKDSELAIYSRISAHKFGTLQFPADLDISVHMGNLLNGLFEPDPEKRLGVKPGVPGTEKIDELKQHPWFGSGYDWEAIVKGTAKSPALKFCADKVKECENDEDPEAWDELFNEIYIPEDEEVDEFEGVTNTGVAALSKSGPKQFYSLMMNAAATKRKVRVFKKKRSDRYNKLRDKGKLRQSQATTDVAERFDDSDDEDEDEPAAKKVPDLPSIGENGVVNDGAPDGVGAAADQNPIAKFATDSFRRAQSVLQGMSMESLAAGGVIPAAPAAAPAAPAEPTTEDKLANINALMANVSLLVENAPPAPPPDPPTTEDKLANINALMANVAMLVEEKPMEA